LGVRDVSKAQKEKWPAGFTEHTGSLLESQVWTDTAMKQCGFFVKALVGQQMYLMIPVKS